MGCQGQNRLHSLPTDTLYTYSESISFQYLQIKRFCFFDFVFQSINLVALLPLCHVMVMCSAIVILYGTFSCCIMSHIIEWRPRSEKYFLSLLLGKTKEKNSMGIALNSSSTEQQRQTILSDKQRHHQCATLQHRQRGEMDNSLPGRAQQWSVLLLHNVDTANKRRPRKEVQSGQCGSSPDWVRKWGVAQGECPDSSAVPHSGTEKDYTCSGSKVLQLICSAPICICEAQYVNINTEQAL